MKLRSRFSPVLTLAVMAMGLALVASADQAPVPSSTPAVAVFDTPADVVAIDNYRTTDDASRLPDGMSRAGLDRLHMHGSAEFSRDAFVRWQTGLRAPLTVFDLRQEAHGFVNGRAITWYGDRDWGQIQLSHDGAIANESALLRDLGAGRRVLLGEAKAVKRGEAAPHSAVIPTEVMSEAQLMQQLGVAYVRLTVTDHLRPDDDEVERFIAVARELPADGHVYFHCRAGQGRTTTFMVMYDMLRNAARVAERDIVMREAALGKDYDLDRLPLVGDWKYPYVLERAAFIHAFYRYARANPDGQPLSWKAWLAVDDRAQE